MDTTSVLMKKRERTQNWALEEKQLLLRLCERNIRYIENKKADSQTSNLKNVAWRTIHKEFVNTFGSDRDCNRLKEQWRRMKGWARSEMLEQRSKEWKRPSALSEHVWRVMEMSHRYQREDQTPQQLLNQQKHEQMSSDEEDAGSFRKAPDGEDLARLGDDSTFQGAQKWESELDHSSLCEVEIKEEPNHVTEDGNSYLYNSYSIPKHSITIERCDDTPKPHHDASTNGVQRTAHDGRRTNDSAGDLQATNNGVNNHEYVTTTTRFRRKRPRSNSLFCDSDPIDGAYGASDDEYRLYKQKELVKRSLILDEELLTARLNRETAEINKRIAEEKLKEMLLHREAM